MATKDTADSSAGSGSGLTTSAIAIAANSNRVLEFAVMIGSASQSVTSVTRNGQSAALVKRTTVGSDVALEIWRIVAPNTGSATATVALTGSVGELYVGWFAAYDVDQSTPASTTLEFTENSFTVGSISPASTSPSDLCVGYFGSFLNPTVAWGAGQSSDEINSSLSWRSIGITSKAGNGGATAISAEIVGEPRSAVFVGHALKHAGGGGHALTAAHGAYSLAGQAAAMRATRKLIAAAGAYALSGQAAGLWRGRRLSAEHAAYALSGQAADLVHSVPMGTLTTKPFKLNNGSVRSGLSGLKVAVLNLTDLSVVALFGGQVTDGSGVLAVTDADIDGGTDYGVVVVDAAGTTIGVDIITATSST